MKIPLQWTGAFNPSYGFNNCGTGPSHDPLGLGGPIMRLPSGAVGYRPIRELELAMPSDMIAIADQPDDPTQDGEIAFHDASDYVAARHNQGSNVLFCDAHIEFDRQANWMKRTDAARRRWNRDHFPHPETW